MKIPKKLFAKAKSEVAHDLRGHLGLSKKKSFEEAGEILHQRLVSVRKSILRFNGMLRDAKINSLIDALAVGHKKDLVQMLKQEPGKISKETAEKIVDALTKA